MVKKKTVLVVIAAIAVVSITGWFYLHTGPKAQIRQRCHVLAERVSTSATGSENADTSPFKMYGLKNYFASECELQLQDFQYNGTYTPEEIAGSVTRLKQQAKAFEVKLYDLDVTMESDKRAHVRLMAQVERKRRGKKQRSKPRQLTCFLRKQEGDWVFHRFQEAAVLEK